MTQHLTHRSSNPRTTLTRAEDDYFGPRRTGSSGMPDPERLAQNLAMRAVEVLAGTRSLDQLNMWITEDVAQEFLLRRALHREKRAVAGERRTIPHALGSSRISRPRDGVVEAVVTIHSRVKSRAVAVRLESIDHRWRATALSVL